MTKPLTKAGSPRKRAAGAGRPNTGRTARLPRIRPDAYARWQAIAQARGCSLAEALEGAVEEVES